MTLSPSMMNEALKERNQYTIDKESQLGRWRADISTMEMQTGGNNLTYRDKLIELKREMNIAEDQLESLKEATGDAWEELKTSVDETWEKLSASLEKVQKELQNQ